MRRVGFPQAFRGVDPLIWRDPSQAIPEVFSPRGRWKAGPLHTFCDDYRQEFFWRRPEEGLIVAMTAGVVTAPDFTVWLDDPEPWKQYQAWRSALVGAYWISQGVDVLPVVSFGSGCECYVGAGSAWAIRGPAAGDEATWRAGVELWSFLAEPGCLVVFGRMPDDVPQVCPVVQRRLVSGKGSM